MAKSHLAQEALILWLRKKIGETHRTKDGRSQSCRQIKLGYMSSEKRKINSNYPNPATQIIFNLRIWHLSGIVS